LIYIKGILSTTVVIFSYPKLLGVTLDEKLNFGQHILNIERKAGNSLGILREIKGLGQIKTKFLLLGKHQSLMMKCF
jgi:hypothetical protein